MLRILTVAALSIWLLSPAQARHYRHPHHRHYRAYDRGSVIGGRPSGCPHAYCGCSASLYLFGRIRSGLNLAMNWIRDFKHVPHWEARPRMAAARAHHVMVLVEHRHGDVWLVHDGNSGGGLTRLHERSIAGYIVVDPNT